ncbi:MAG: hypothetical protein WC783_00745 [Candidatus Paceibacterota bacterium]|jgi:hypothetical protein
MLYYYINILVAQAGELIEVSKDNPMLLMLYVAIGALSSALIFFVTLYIRKNDEILKRSDENTKCHTELLKQNIEIWKENQATIEALKILIESLSKRGN